MKQRVRRLILILPLLAVCFAGAGAWYVYRAPYFAAMRFDSASEGVITHFSKQVSPTRADYEGLVGYMLEGFLTYSTPHHARARYPGLPAGGASRAEQEMEGFSRIAPLLAVWLKSSDTDVLRLPNGRDIDVAAMLRGAVIAGTNPRDAEYWGEIKDRDQRIAEAADVALALWLAREDVWDELAAPQRQQIGDWLRQVNGKVIADNNWHLFVAQVNVALQALGAAYDAASIDLNLKRTLEFYRGDGWFNDGPEGPVDYYNAWGFYYHVGWIHRMNPALLGDVVRNGLPAFANDLLHLLGPQGMPVMGRSVCYRLAVSAPLTFASQIEPHAIPSAQARRALDVTWQFFLAHGAIEEGRITQGYCGDDAAVLDNYSGAASCQWSLRSLVVALDIPPDAPFWSEPAAPLPVEIADFDRRVAGGAYIAQGRVDTLDVTLVNPQPLPPERTRLQGYSFKDRVISAIRGGSRRPSNLDAKYGRATYGSREPFCGCAQ
jgi:hypothetical protein